MKHHDEDEVARRLGAPTPPPPPGLAARIKSEIPERLEIPSALTAPPGTLPLIGRLSARHLVLALAATVLVAVAAVLVARRVLLPDAGPPLEVALIESAPAPDSAAVPTAAAPSQIAAQEVTASAPVVEPLAKAAAAPGREEAGKGRREASRESAKLAHMPAAASGAAPPAQVPPSAPKAAAEAAVAEPSERHGVEGGVVGGVPGGLVETTSAPLDEAAIVYRVGGPVSAPELIHRVDPVYPEAARRARLQGVVVMEVVIDRDGAVRETRLLRNTTRSEECAEAALSAVRTWRYRPAQLEGRPVAVYLTVAIAFRPE